MEVQHPEKSSVGIHDNSRPPHAPPRSLPRPCRFLAQTPGSALQSPVPIGILTHAVSFNRVYPH